MRKPGVLAQQRLDRRPGRRRRAPGWRSARGARRRRRRRASCVTVAKVRPHAPASSWRANSCGDIVVLPCGARSMPQRRAWSCIHARLWSSASRLSSAIGSGRSPAARSSPCWPMALRRTRRVRRAESPCSRGRAAGRAGRCRSCGWHQSGGPCGCRPTSGRAALFERAARARAQASIACGQRVRKTQPEGGAIGLGMSPLQRHVRGLGSRVGLRAGGEQRLRVRVQRPREQLVGRAPPPSPGRGRARPRGRTGTRRRRGRAR